MAASNRDGTFTQTVTGRVLPVGELPDHSRTSVDLEVPARALAVGAHPDDIEFGCGGTLAKWAAAGCSVHHLVLTDGSKGSWDPGADRSALISTRQSEQREAARIVGGSEVEFMGYVDGELHSGLEERKAVCAAIRRTRPQVVLSHDPWRRYRLHPDHRHAGWITVDAVVAARDDLFFPELELSAHRPDAVLLWEADEANHVENVSSTIEVKLAALLAHRSQRLSTMGIGPTDDPAEGEQRFAQRVSAQLARHGALAGLPLGEAFRLITEV